MDYLNEEYKDMMNDKTRLKMIKKDICCGDVEEGRKKLDAFFASLEENPYCFLKDGCSLTDIARYEEELEKSRCMRKITVLETRLRELYSEFDNISFAMMGDPLYGEIGEEVLSTIMKSIVQIDEMIEYYHEQVEILEWDNTQGGTGND